MYVVTTNCIVANKKSVLVGIFGTLLAAFARLMVREMTYKDVTSWPYVKETSSLLSNFAPSVLHSFNLDFEPPTKILVGISLSRI